MYWEENSTLLLADLHLGKADHFSRSGIRLPSAIHDQDLQKLQSLLLTWTPKAVVLLGDVFHSRVAQEFDTFATLVQAFSQVHWTLIKGNHDVVDPVHYTRIGVEVVEHLMLKPFWLTHSPSPHAQAYNLAGHLHPGVSLSGKARQHIRIPCFYFGAREGILPAFGNFTGCISMPKRKGVRIFAVAGDQVIPLHADQ